MLLCLLQVKPMACSISLAILCRIQLDISSTFLVFEHNLIDDVFVEAVRSLVAAGIAYVMSMLLALVLARYVEVAELATTLFQYVTLPYLSRYTIDHLVNLLLHLRDAHGLTL